MFSQALFTFSLSFKLSRAANLLEISIWYCSLISSALSFWDEISPHHTSVLLVYLALSLRTDTRVSNTFFIAKKCINCSMIKYNARTPTHKKLSQKRVLRCLPPREIFSPVTKDICGWNNHYLLFCCVCIAVSHILHAGLLARSQYSEGPATGHLDTCFSWFPCVYKRMLRWFPRLQVATACFSCSPPDLNFLDLYLIFMYMHNNHCHRVTAHLQLNIIIIIKVNSSFSSQNAITCLLWLLGERSDYFRKDR